MVSHIYKYIYIYVCVYIHICLICFIILLTCSIEQLAIYTRIKKVMKPGYLLNLQPVYNNMTLCLQWTTRIFFKQFMQGALVPSFTKVSSKNFF